MALSDCLLYDSFENQLISIDLWVGHTALIINSNFLHIYQKVLWFCVCDGVCSKSRFLSSPNKLLVKNFSVVS
jgi:hypothetical protein